MRHRQPGSIPLLCWIAILVPAGLASGQVEHTAEITYQELMAHAEFLADDQLEGRAAGSEGASLAAAYIAAEYERLGLVPVGDEQTYFQNFSLPRGFKALPTTSLVSTRGNREYVFDFNKEIYPLPTSTTGKAEGAVVFAGYGISAPDLNFDDYEGLDVQGKIVVVLRGLPNDQSRKNPFHGTGAARRFATLRSKQDTAAAMGAAGLVVVNDPVNHGSKSDDTLVTSGGREQGTIPALHMTYAAGRKLFSGTGLSLSKTQKLIDARLEPRSREIDSLHVKLVADLEVEHLLVRNVVGLLEGAAPGKKDEVLVVGAHFDHIGRGEYGSLGGSKAQGQVHNGADDNASGTAGVMEIAGYLMPRVEVLMRDVLFICFSAEEIGLLGSKHYVDAPIIPLEKTAAMINLDMVSYLARTKKLEIYGTGTSPAFESILEEANKGIRVKTKMVRGAGRGMSDHAPFFRKGLPVLFFITGLHKNYHRPEDDVKAMDKRGFEKVVRLAGEATLALAKLEKKPVFVPVEGGGMEAGPYLGISLEDRDDGLFVAEVADGSPAAKGGMHKDDRIEELNDREVRSVSLFFGMWAGVQGGQRVEFLVRRNGRLRTLRVQLEK